ncbi:hypothetical protein BGY98DRAFT_1012596 [Russula aff. rugulosa BPL654]|nr:hypothetical protein BGY98DRAFT_1012596 [Russula aff. rugulosa BPL654]
MRPGDARGAAGAATPQSPPGLRQPAWGTRATASPPTTTTSARGGVPTSSQWPTPGQPHLPSTRSTPSAWTSSSSRSDRPTGPDADAASAPWPRQGNGRQRGRESTSASSSTFSDHLSTGRPGSRSPVFHPRDGGFPTYADTTWGDPIAAAHSATSRSAVGDDIADGQAGGDTNERGNAEAGQEELETAGQNDRTGRGRGNRIRGRRGTPRRTATSPPAAASTTQDVSPPNVLDVKLPPAGPSDQWCSENVEW